MRKVFKFRTSMAVVFEIMVFLLLFSCNKVADAENSTPTPTSTASSKSTSSPTLQLTSPVPTSTPTSSGNGEDATNTDNGNGIITDSVTGLIWQKEDDHIQRTWADAVNYCNTLTLGSYSNWRLPEFSEFLDIVNNPAITFNLPNRDYSTYWSVSGAAGYDFAWSVNFPSGTSNGTSKKYTYYVRCVR